MEEGGKGGEEVLGEPPGADEGGQEEGVGPDQDAPEKAREGPFPGAPLPEEAEKPRRGELGHGHEGDEPHAHQGVGLPRQAEVEVGEEEDGEDRAPPEEEEVPEGLAAEEEGARRWWETRMERARVSTTTMAVAAETPPKKARKARAAPPSRATART